MNTDLVRCDLCMAHGQPRRMDLENCICFYCRADPPGDCRHSRAECSRLRETNAALVMALEVCVQHAHWLVEAIRDRRTGIDEKRGPHLRRLHVEMGQDIVSLNDLEGRAQAAIKRAEKEEKT